MSKSQNIYEKLSAVQQELKVPKGQRNNFGNYNYRSCEDIVEAAKPVLAKHGLTLVISDELVYIGERYYIKATATIGHVRDIENALVDSISATGYAREEESKKGMDGSQITGAASSYARKYALNGLFNIDDTKDADTSEMTKTTNQNEWVPSETKPASLTQKEQISNMLRQRGYLEIDAQLEFLADNYGLKRGDMSEADAVMILNDFKLEYKEIAKKEMQPA